jgi:hypothetical protein
LKIYLFFPNFSERNDYRREKRPHFSKKRWGLFVGSFHPEIQISGWKHLDTDLGTCQKPFLIRVSGREISALGVFSSGKGLFRMRTR